MYCLCCFLMLKTPHLAPSAKFNKFFTRCLSERTRILNKILSTVMRSYRAQSVISQVNIGYLISKSFHFLPCFALSNFFITLNAICYKTVSPSMSVGVRECQVDASSLYKTVCLLCSLSKYCMRESHEKNSYMNLFL